MVQIVGLWITSEVLSGFWLASPAMVSSGFGTSTLHTSVQNRPLPSADSAMARLSAARAAAMAGELRRIQRELVGAVPRDGWTGPARLAFAAELQQRVSLLDPVIQRYDGYAAALQSYALGLSLLEPRLAARPVARSAGAGAGSDGSGAPGAPGVDDTAVRLFEQAWQEWDALRRRCQQALSVAGRIGADRHGLSAMWHAVSHGAHEALDHVSLKELSKVLSDLGDVLMVAGLVLSVVFPPAAAAVWVALAVVAVAQLAVDGTRLAKGEKGVGWGDVASDAAGVLPLGKMFRGAKTAEECSRLIEKLPEEQRYSRIVPGGLMSHEGATRGHLNARHIRKSRRYLMDRFKAQPHIPWASSFKDRRSAEASASWLLERDGAKIKAWLKAPTNSLPLEGDFGSHIGRCFSKDGRMVKATKLRLILVPEQSALGYLIVTGHPYP